MKSIKTYLCMMPLLGSMALCSSCQNDIDNATVARLDVNRFMGVWYEIARYNHRFEEGMTHVTADYTLLPDGKIKVVNQGIKDGELKEIEGKAKQPEPEKYPGHLQVSFFLWFYSDYDILYLDDDYRYAIIGGDTDKYLWILSRTPQIPASELDKLLNIIKQRGYDTSKLLFVKQ